MYVNPDITDSFMLSKFFLPICLVQFVKTYNCLATKYHAVLNCVIKVQCVVFYFSAYLKYLLFVYHAILVLNEDFFTQLIVFFANNKRSAKH